MPELVNISVGSLPGTSGLEATTVWPLAAKKSRKLLRMSATETGAVMLALESGVGLGAGRRQGQTLPPRQARHFPPCRGGPPRAVASGTAGARAKGYPVRLGAHRPPPEHPWRRKMDMKTSPLAQLNDPSLLKTDGLINGQWVKGGAR